jgi:outer membrane immunogenic protein
MGKLFLRRVALFALAIPLPANAADLSSSAYKVRPPTWTGSYFGIYGGASGATGSSFGLGGGLVGGTAGYNWQNGTFVFGIEGDGGWAGLTGTTNCLAAVFTCRASDSWLSSVRGRLGWTVRPNVLLYATAGGAFGNVREAINSNGSASSDQAGWSAGAGFEWMLVPNWSFKAEYLHYDLGTFVCAAGACARGQAVNVPFAFDTGKVGINYHFSSGSAMGWY